MCGRGLVQHLWQVKDVTTEVAMVKEQGDTSRYLLPACLHAAAQAHEE